MVFGNMGSTSATGVAFTRDPSTGEHALYGEYLINAQGEDVVAGIRTPEHLTRDARLRAGADGDSLEEAMPQPFAELTRTFALLEQHYRDMQDVEFTIERGKLWMLQTRSGKRSAKAAIKIAVDMAGEGLITKREAVMRVEPSSLDQLLHRRIDRSVPHQVIATGLPASPGAASGKVVFDAEEAERAVASGERVILVRTETCPEDIHGMHAAAAILTARGGMTSHAAVVARGMGRPCVSGAGSIHIDHRRKIMRIGELEVGTSGLITLDGSTGEVMLGDLPTVAPELPTEFDMLSSWADRYRRMRVRANADTPEDCRVALRFGAEGIGLCRTEHMFFDEQRIAAVREMILAESDLERSDALARLLPEQRNDFTEIFRIMEGRPVTIRLLDPPLHEFLPHSDAGFAGLSKAANIEVGRLRRRASDLSETNPMLGHRGCRLGITCPEIYEMQARAILEAAVTVLAETGQSPSVEIMVPLVATAAELQVVRELIDRTAREVFAEQGTRVDYLVGTMIELPRAALRAGDIAGHAQFFSFGTNDLTQTTLGLSRDDAGKFLPRYVDQALLPHDPFVTIDREGVGELVALAVKRGKAARPGLKLGICGEHGGDPMSIDFFDQVGLDYVSASPYRVMIARFAAAQSAIRERRTEGSDC
jgi:pyruvate,orthophosphate dikinase